MGGGGGGSTSGGGGTQVEGGVICTSAFWR